VPGAGAKQVTITGRRPIGGGTTITWSWTAAPNARLTPTMLDAVEREIARIADEYGVG
jgi:hypothetical protein